MKVYDDINEAQAAVKLCGKAYIAESGLIGLLRGEYSRYLVGRDSPELRAKINCE
jgi:hypothetical protein